MIIICSLEGGRHARLRRASRLPQPPRGGGGLPPAPNPPRSGDVWELRCLYVGRVGVFLGPGCLTLSNFIEFGSSSPSYLILL